MTNRYIPTIKAGLTALASAMLAGCQSAPPLPPTSPEVVGEFRAGSGYLRGYLDRKALPNSLALLPKDLMIKVHAPRG